MRYSPFSKPLRDIRIDDLDALKSVEEGWYVEYKRELLSQSAIAKSVSAFANHFGGWLFFGVEESGDGRRTAGRFSGIERADVPESLTRIRDAVRAHINPTPHFDVRVVDALPRSPTETPRSIIIVEVPAGADPPYIHSSGRIYRRVADSSDPKAESDRTVIDMLVERSRRRRKHLRDFLERLHTVSQAEANNSYLRVFFLQDPLGDRGDYAALSFEEFAAIATHQEPDSIGLTFDNLFTMSQGFVARHVGANDPEYRLLTWEYYRDGSSAVTIPLRQGDPRGNKNAMHASEFLSLAPRVTPARVVDVNQLLLFLAATFRKHRSVMTRASISGPVLAKARLVNIWRRIPFYDTKAYLSFVHQHGVPISQDDRVFAPPSTEPGTFVEISMDLPDTSSTMVGIVQDLTLVIPIFMWILEALGVPREVLRDSTDELYLAAQRSVDIRYVAHERKP